MAKSLGNKKWDYHAGKHATQAPHVETVIVLLKVDEQFGALEVARGDPYVVFCVGVIVFSEAPVNKPELSLLVINHDVVRFHISVHNTARVAEVEGLEQLGDVVAHVKVGEPRVERLEVGAV